MKIITQIKEIKGKKTFLRCDFNVPIKNGHVVDENRIKESLETINYLSKKGAKVIIGSHMGQPKGKATPETSLQPVATNLSRLLKKTVKLIPESIGPKAESAVSELTDGQVVLLQNLRWHKSEEEGDERVAKQMAKMYDIYVNDAFASAHRPHISVYTLAKLLPHYAGFLMQKEVDHLSKLTKNTREPFIIIMGGSKIADKIKVIDNLADKVDKILIGGAMGNTFLASRGNEMSKSVYEPEVLDIAREYLAKYQDKIMLPVDNIKAEVEGGFSYMDIGPVTINNYKTLISQAKTVFWNGNLGYSESKDYAVGTNEIAKSIAKNRGCFSVVAGGDTVAAIDNLKLKNKFSFISTGGGAALEYLAGEKLPGIEALK